jgi:hypothetical protein
MNIWEQPVDVRIATAQARLIEEFRRQRMWPSS